VVILANADVSIEEWDCLCAHKQRCDAFTLEDECLLDGLS
jgi:hypothetical protein